MWQQLRIAGSLFFVLTIATGVIYPVLVTVIAQIVFGHQANGSIVLRDNQPIGSELIGQSFTQPQYFWGRPSATSTVPYNAMAGSGSNLACSNPALVEAVKNRMEILRKSHPENDKQLIPVELVTTSASGLDPHISPAGALYQVDRIAQVRGVSKDSVKDIVQRNIEYPVLGCIGQSRVNVLRLNLALDEAYSNTKNRKLEKTP